MNIRKTLTGILAAGMLASASSAIGQNIKPGVSNLSTNSFNYLEKRIASNEGYRTKMYHDDKGNPTIGIGFNLTRKDAREKLERVGADYDLIMQRKQELNEEQIVYLFKKTKDESIKEARSDISNFDSQPEEVKGVVYEMIFQHGLPEFLKYKKTRKHIENRDYTNAALEMKDSNWYRRYTTRASELVNVMDQAAQKYNLK